MNVNQIKTIFLILAAIARCTHAQLYLGDDCVETPSCCNGALECDSGGSGECRLDLGRMCDPSLSDLCFQGEFGREVSSTWYATLDIFSCWVIIQWYFSVAGLVCEPMLIPSLRRLGEGPGGEGPGGEGPGQPGTCTNNCLELLSLGESCTSYTGGSDCCGNGKYGSIFHMICNSWYLLAAPA